MRLCEDCGKLEARVVELPLFPDDPERPFCALCYEQRLRERRLRDQRRNR